MIYTEISHFSHPHVLKPETNETPFTCDGCREAGWGLRFRCANCNYDLHKDCALSTPSITHHMFRNSFFRFHKLGPDGAVCKACGKPLVGFVYVSGGKMLHCCCASLPPVILPEIGGLHLEKHVWSSCLICQRRNLFGRVRGWSYKSTCRKYHLHVSCVKDMVEKWVMDKWQREHVVKIGTNSMDVKDVMDVKRLNGTSTDGIDVVLNRYFSYVMGDPLGGAHFFKAMARGSEMP